MSQAIENKVVEFQFNNTNFEKNVKTSMSTLDKLKKALNFDGASKSLQSLDQATKNFDMSSMDKSVDGLGSKFSALQTIAIGALLKIGEQALVTGEQLVKSLTIDQIAAGFDKYTQKVQAVATIMSATGLSIDDVEKQLADLNTYTDRTSYGFSQMVDNVGKFTSAGVELEDAVKAMEGIGNWASLSGVTAASGKAAIAMYNLSQAMGQGYLLMQDWRSIENVNMATKEFKQTLIDTGVAMGELEVGADGLIYTLKGTEVNAENLRGSLADRWVNKEVMLATLKRYSDETDVLGQKAYKAAAEARTFEDALGAVNDAISTSWMKTHELIFGDYEEATKFWTGVQDYVLAIFDKTMTARNEIFGGALQNTSWQQLKDLFEGLNHEETTFEDQVIKMAKNHGIAIDEMIEAEGSLFEVSKKGIFTTSMMSDVFGDFVTSLVREAATLDISNEAWTERDRVIQRIVNGELGFGDELRRNVRDLGYGNAEIEEASRRLNLIGAGIEWITEEQWEALGYTSDEVAQLKLIAQELDNSDSALSQLVKDLGKASGRDLLIDSLKNSADGLLKVFGAIKDAWNDIFPPFTSERLYHLIEGINELSKRLIPSNEQADKLRRTFRGLFAIVDILSDIISGVFSVGLAFIKGLFGEVDGSILDLTASIGDAISGFRDWLKENEVISTTFQNIAEFAGQAAGKIVEFVQSVAESETVTSVVEFFSTQFSTLFENISNFVDSHGGLIGIFDSILGYLEKGYQTAKNWITNIFSGLDLKSVWSNVKLFFENLWTAIKELFTKDTLDKIKETGGSFEKLKEIFEGFKDGASDSVKAVITALTNLKDSFKTWFDKIKTDTEGFVGWIVTAFQNIKKYLLDNIPGLIPLAIGAGTFAAIYGAIKMVIKIFQLIKPLTDLIKSFANLNNAKSFSMRLDAIADLFKAIGLAVLMIAGSLKLISTIDDLSTPIWTLVGILGGLIVIVGVLALFSKKLTSIQGVDFKGIALSIGALVLGIFLVAVSLKILETLDPNRIGDTLLAFGAIVLAILGAYWVFQKLGKGNDAKLSKGALFALAFAGAVKVIASAMKIIGDMSVAQIFKSIVVIGLISVFIGLLAKLSQGVSWSGTLLIAGIAAGFWLLGKAIQSFDSVDFESMGKFFVAFLPMLFAMFAALAATKLAGQNALGAAAALVAVGAALFLMAKAMDVMDDIDSDRFGAITLAIMGFMAVMAGVIASTKAAGSQAMKAAVTVLGVSAACVILAGAMWLIAKIPEDKLLASALVIGGLLGMLSVVILSTKSVSKTAMGPLIAAVAAVAVLAAAIVALSLITDPANVIASGAALSAVMLSFSAMFYVIGKTSSVQKGVMLQLLELVGIVALLGVILTAMSQFKMESDVVANAGALSLLIGALTIVLFLLSKMNVGADTAKAIGALALMVVIAALAGAVIVGLNAFGPDAEQAIGYAEALGILIGALTVALMGLSVVGLLGAAAFVGIGALATLVVAGGALAVLLGWLASLSEDGGFGALVKDGIDLLIIISTGLGEAIGGFVGGVFDAAMSHLPSIGESIASFVEKLKTAFKDVDEDMLDAAATLAGVVLIFTVAEFIDGLVNFFSFGQSNLDKFGGELETFGAHLATFYENTKSIDDPSRFRAVAESTKTLGEFVGALPKTIPDKTDIEEFGGGLESFASSIQVFGDKAASTDLVAVRNGAKAAQLIANFANSLVKTGGILQALAGETTSLDDFGKQVELFGESIVAFGGTLADFTQEDVDRMDIAVGAGEKLNDLASKLQNQDGFIGKIFGEKDLGDFGTQIELFGDGLKNYVKHIRDLTNDDVEKAGIAASIAEPLVQMSNQLNTSEHWYDVFRKDMDFGEWGKQIVEFGEGLVDYSEVLQDLDEDSINKALPAITGLVQISKYLSDSTGFSTSVNTIAYLAQEIVNFDNALTNAITNDLPGRIEGFVDAVCDFKIQKEDMIPSASEQGEITSAITILFDDVTQIVKDAIENFVDIGEEMATNLGAGISNETEYMVLTMGQLAEDATSAAKAQYMDFWETGVFVAKGFIAGIRYKKTDSYSAGYDLGAAARDGMRDVLDQHSPSRVAYESGTFFGIGFINALDDYSDRVYDAAYAMGAESNFGLEDAISHIDAILGNELNTSPVITPVIDLTEIQNGADRINNLLGNDSYSLKGSVNLAGSVSTSMEATRLAQIPNSVAGQNSTNNVTNQFTNNFTVQTNDPYDFATRVSEIMQSQVERSNAVWA